MVHFLKWATLTDQRQHRRGAKKATLDLMARRIPAIASITYQQMKNNQVADSCYISVVDKAARKKQSYTTSF
jgi:hypothetical protein